MISFGLSSNLLISSSAKSNLLPHLPSKFFILAIILFDSRISPGFFYHFILIILYLLKHSHPIFLKFFNRGVPLFFEPIYNNCPEVFVCYVQQLGPSQSLSFPLCKGHIFLFLGRS